MRNEVFREYQWFKEGAESVHIGNEDHEMAKRKRLLYLFVKDLSSGVSGDVLSNKDQRDSSIMQGRIERVSLEWKIAGWVFVIVLNVGLLFYIYLFAIRQTQSRQSAWFQSFVMWFVFDFFIAGTGVVLVTHLLIPLSVMSDIRTIKKKVVADIISFRQSLNAMIVRRYDIGSNGEKGRHVNFNAAKYLFTSWRVASLFPDLPESILILQFNTPWPKRSLEKGTFFILGSFLYCHELVQDFILQLVCNS